MEKQNEYRWLVLAAKKLLEIEDGNIACPSNPFYEAARKAMLEELRTCLAELTPAGTGQP